MRGNLEAAASAGAGLFENQRDVLTAQRIMSDACLFLCLEICGKVNHAFDFFRREVKHLKKVFSLEIHNRVPPVYWYPLLFIIADK